MTLAVYTGTYVKAKSIPFFKWLIQYYQYTKAI